MAEKEIVGLVVGHKEDKELLILLVDKPRQRIINILGIYRSPGFLERLFRNDTWGRKILRKMQQAEKKYGYPANYDSLETAIMLESPFGMWDGAKNYISSNKVQLSKLASLCGVIFVSAVVEWTALRIGFEFFAHLFGIFTIASIVGLVYNLKK